MVKEQLNTSGLENDGKSYSAEGSIAYSVTIPNLTNWESLDEFGPQFNKISWHDLPEPEELVLTIFGEKISSTTFGIQRLDTAESSVERHQENEFELVYPLVGSNATMTVDDGLTCSRNRINTHKMSGAFESEIDLKGQKLQVMNNGNIQIGEKIIEPVVTRAGRYHGTEGGPLIYLVIKGVQVQ